MNNKKQNRVKIISCFTGGGFMDIGFEQAGFETVWTNEVESQFAEMYASGITSWRKSNGENHAAEISEQRPLQDIPATEIIDAAFGKNVPDIFGIIGGPPCQDFSIAGNIKGFNGERGKLTATFLERVSELSPGFFVMENVEGLRKVKKNRDKLLDLLKNISDQFYIVTNVLNALEYGVPQDRKRLFIVGFSRSHFANADFDVPNKFNWPEKLYENPLDAFNWPSRNPFGGRPRKAKGIPSELCVKSCLVNEKSRTLANASEVFKAYSDKFYQVAEGDTRSQSFKRLHRFRYSPTACYGNNEVHLHPFKPRRLSVREVLRIQGVPDEYVLPSLLGKKRRHVGLSAKFKMIGNGVPPPLVREVAKSVFEFINKIKRPTTTPIRNALRDTAHS